ncbi:hypothetical protein HW49_07560 [Porphyromonadaceae bacterium COT-184 OH4590]|nr:hypothetical protein HW49_07560 [Porphyromonadaceae bacterium COT-184 OH4590]
MQEQFNNNINKLVTTNNSEFEETEFVASDFVEFVTKLTNKNIKKEVFGANYLEIEAPYKYNSNNRDRYYGKNKNRALLNKYINLIV